ncbi:MAG: hypothetical protein QOF16_1832 [Actinomycetota bacterium]|jgi:hypothetical protein|nr:hypothetical protein [Actinomycetota bacterium]
MTPLPVLWAASLLLIAGGVAKVRHPGATVPALRAAGIPAHRNAVIALGTIEVAVGLGAITGVSQGFAVLVAILYAAFAAFSARLVVVGAPGVSCGCAGERALPPSWLHAVLNSIAAIGASVAAIAHTDIPNDSQLVVLGLGSFAIAWAAFLAVAYVPTLFGSYRGTQ